LTNKNLNLLFTAIILLGSILSFYLYEKNNYFDKKENFRNNLIGNFKKDSLLIVSNDFLENSAKQKLVESSEFSIEIKSKDSTVYWNKTNTPSEKKFFKKTFNLQNLEYSLSLDDAPFSIKRNSKTDTFIFWTWLLGLTFLLIWIIRTVNLKDRMKGFVILASSLGVSIFLSSLLFQFSDNYGLDKIGDFHFSINLYALILIGSFFVSYFLFGKSKLESMESTIILRYSLTSLLASIIIFFICISAEKLIGNGFLRFKAEEALNLEYKELSFVILSTGYIFLFVFVVRRFLGNQTSEKNSGFVKSIALIIPVIIVSLITLSYELVENVVPIALFLIIVLLLLDLYFEYFEINLSFLLTSVLVFSMFLGIVLYRSVEVFDQEKTNNTLSTMFKKIEQNEKMALFKINDSIVNSEIIPSLSALPYPINIDINDLKNYFYGQTTELRGLEISNVFLNDANGKSLAINQISNINKIEILLSHSEKLNDYVFFDDVNQQALLHYNIENKSDASNPLSLSILFQSKKNKQISFPYKSKVGIYKKNKLVKSFSNEENLFPSRYNDVSHQDITSLYTDRNFKVVQIKGKNFTTKFLTLVTLFISIFGVILFVLIFINSKYKFIGPRHNLSLNISNSLRNRFQTTIVSLILISFILIGATTAYYYNKLYEVKNNTVFETITNLIIKEIENDLPEAEEVGYENKVEKLFSKLDDNLPCQIAFYKSNGEQLLTSSEFTNAPYRLKREGLRYINREQQADKNLIISYEYDEDKVLIPAYNYRKKILGYFLTEKADRGSRYAGLYDFVSTLLTVCVFLFLTSLAMSMLISKPMTLGLKNLAVSLQNFKLGKSNQTLVWKNNDEIGELIDNFNKLQVELNSAAEMLSKTQREMAWREMAKQVAHEIKNPLTPMKLSLQHMQMTALNADESKLKLLIDKTSRTVLEQIENLTQIANEFYSFGTLPTSSNENVVINEVVEHIHDLFRKRGDMDIILEEPINEITVFADRNQLVRILNNIVKNATQSIPENKRGNIVIELNSNDTSAVICVKDNGTGITENMREKVFTPNFTTKSSGTGLGLAISANMIESMNGKIYFTSPNELGGTNFYIELPIIRPEAQAEENNDGEIVNLD
jgi:signal transduction histidine kinase/heme/copper-type cytochrome/quinol oxidase subunit 2